MERYGLVNHCGKTGSKDVPLKTAGHDKIRVSVSLTDKGDGSKLKSFVVSGAAKRESKSLHEEYSVGALLHQVQIVG